MCFRKLFGGGSREIGQDDREEVPRLEAPKTGDAGLKVEIEKPKEREMAILKKDDYSSSPRESSGNINALLGKGSEFDGKLTFEGTVRIDGKFTGEIFSEDTLIIGEGARIKAEISVLYGEIVGNVKAAGMVEMHAPARLIGNIETPSMLIETGVTFEGACKMENLKKNEKVTFIKSEVSAQN